MAKIAETLLDEGAGWRVRDILCSSGPDDRPFEEQHDRLAKSAGLSPYHFLRIFTRLTGTTPHQFALRARLRAAAFRLTGTPDRIIDVALESGFGDVSNFNRAFRAEFGVTPRGWRRQTGCS